MRSPESILVLPFVRFSQSRLRRYVDTSSESSPRDHDPRTTGAAQTVDSSPERPLVGASKLIDTDVARAKDRTGQEQASGRYCRILRPRRSLVTCATCR